MVDVNPEWTGESLLVNPELEHDPDCITKVVATVFYGTHLRNFNATRWVGYGSSSRMLTVALSVGIDEVAKLALADPVVSPYYLHGIAKCTENVRRHALVASVVSWVADTPTALIMHDDRVLRNLDRITDGIKLEMDNISVLPAYVWKRLATIIGGGRRWVQVRDMAIRWMYISWLHVEEGYYSVNTASV